MLYEEGARALSLNNLGGEGARNMKGESSQPHESVGGGS